MTNVSDENFNKLLNQYFDTKTLFNNQNKKIDLFPEFKKIKKLNLKHLISNTEKKKIKLKKFNFKSYPLEKKLFLYPLQSLFNELKNSKLRRYFKYFLIHGSLADGKYIKGWSDVDTFVVLKNEIFEDKNKLLQIRKFIKNLYKYFYEICPLQHHGLIIYTEHDLLNYSKNYIPLESLKYNINLLNQKKTITIHLQKNKNLKIFTDIKDRLSLLKDAEKEGYYKHHPLKNEYLKFPLKENSKQMYQLFCHIGYMNTLPAYFLTAINKSKNKKDSFVLFYKYFKNKKFKNLFIKNEIVRKFWEKNSSKNFDDFYIPRWVIKILGKNYLDECILIFKCIINQIKLENEKK